MSALDILYYVLVVGVIGLLVILGLTAYHIIQTLKHLQAVLRDAKHITSDIEKTKENIKSKVYPIAQIATQVLGFFFK